MFSELVVAYFYMPNFCQAHAENVFVVFIFFVLNFVVKQLCKKLDSTKFIGTHIWTPTWLRIWKHKYATCLWKALCALQYAVHLRQAPALGLTGRLAGVGK